MINKEITYVSLDGATLTKTYAFNLSQQDFVRMQLKYSPGIQEFHAQMMAEGNLQGAYDMLADLIEFSYGVREGDSFVKNRVIGGVNSRPDLANFKFHPAFDELMIQLMQDMPTLLEFFRNITSVQMTQEEFDTFAEVVRKEQATSAAALPDTELASMPPVVIGMDLANAPDFTGGDDSPQDEPEPEKS